MYTVNFNGAGGDIWLPIQMTKPLIPLCIFTCH